MTSVTLTIPHNERPFSGGAVLVYYDGPMLFWLPVAGQHWLAMALPAGAGKWPYLVMELPQAQAEALWANQLTLLAAVRAAERCWLMPDYGADQLVLSLVTEIPVDWLPGDVCLAKQEGAT